VTATSSALFRFDAERHEYVDLDTGAVLPHITGMLEATGWIDSTWYSDEDRDRGTAVHRLTADYDLDALDLASCVSPFRGWLLAHVNAVQIVRPQILAVEEPIVHPVYKYGGRPDRQVVIERAFGVWEGKTGRPEKSHAIQTALQAFLVALEHNLPAEMVRRWCVYLQDKGKWKLEEHTRRADFDEARRIIRLCCRR
jgi:hypothetical protein